jgi:hypothetical protein
MIYLKVLKVEEKVMNEVLNQNTVSNMVNDLNGKVLKDNLLEYKSKIERIYNLYISYFKSVGLKTTGISLSDNEQIENLMARRYEFGLNLDKTFLDENETEEVLSKIATLREKAILEGGTKPIMPKKEKDDRLEMFYSSYHIARKDKANIEKALDTYNRTGDINPMIDIYMRMLYVQKLVVISNSIAENLSKNGIVQSKDEFLQTLRSSKPYEQLNKVYEQFETKEKREELLPETYIMKNMSDTTQLDTISEETKQRLLDKENSYLSEYLKNLSTMLSNPSEAKDKQLAENQNHDFAWGIVLTDPVDIMKDETVNSPIFKGKITVEKIGAFSEYSLFRKRQREREYQVKVRKDAKIKGNIGKTIQKLTSKKDDDEKDSKYQYKTMRHYFYEHEACKTLSDDILRVTKTNERGEKSESIIFSPMEYTGLRSSNLNEFVKNVYLSDYMLDIAEKNGGYAGRIMKNANGYFVSNKYNYEEIASAVLFQSGQEGNILDNRNGENKRRYTKVKKETFLELIKQKRKEKEIEAYE